MIPSREERTGYLYMEFKRQESDTYITIGMGLRARKNKKLETWYFCITLYSSIVSKPNISELTQLAYSFCESITLPPSPIRFLNSVLEYAILFCTSL